MKIKKVGWIALRVLGGLFALVIALAGVAILILKTDWGGERLRRQVVTQANKAILGHLEIGRLSFDGDRLTVWNVTLRDPDAQPVASVARAEVDVSIPALFRREIRVTGVAIETPRLNLVSDAQGSNLARAVAPRERKPPKPTAERKKTAEDGWVIRLDRFDLTGGDVLVSDGRTARPTVRVHLAQLHAFLRARYALGNGNLDVALQLDGRSAAAPAGPLQLALDAAQHGDLARLDLRGELLGGTVKAKANLDRRHLDSSDASLVVDIPPITLADHRWGPVQIDGQLVRGVIPRLELLLKIPGVTLAGKGAGQERFKFEGRLALLDLAGTTKAIRALTGNDVAPVSGTGRVDFSVNGPMAGAPASWAGEANATIDSVRVAETVIKGLSIKARTTQLSSRPAHAELAVEVATVRAGTTVVQGAALDLDLRDQVVTVEATTVAPARVSVRADGRLDDDRQGLALERLAIAYPQGKWTSEGTARARFAGESVSLAGFHLVSQGQRLAIDAQKSGEQLDAHLMVEKLHLEWLPDFVVEPALHLGGVIDVDVTAKGASSNPRVVARVNGAEVRFKKFTRIAVQVNATLADHRVDGALEVEGPFLKLDGKLSVPVDPLAGGPIDVALDLSRLDLSEALRAATPPRKGVHVDGRLAMKLHLTGSAHSPKADVTIQGRELQLRRPATVAARNIDVGHVQAHLTYGDRSARAEIDFSAAQGGTLRADAATRMDLSYPHVTRPIVAAKLPVRGKVVARNFDVAWIAGLSQRLQTMAGQVSADARIEGTAGDPQFIGDVRWKDGKVVALTPPAPAPPP